jgi:hypothetical protein
MWWNKTQNVMAERPSPRRLNLIAESMPYCQTPGVLEKRKCLTSLFHLWTSNASTYCWKGKMSNKPLFIFFHSIQWSCTHTTVNISKWETSMQYMLCKLFWGEASIFLITSPPCRYLFDRVTNYRLIVMGYDCYSLYKHVWFIFHFMMLHFRYLSYILWFINLNGFVELVYVTMYRRKRVMYIARTFRMINIARTQKHITMWKLNHIFKLRNLYL